MAKKPEKKKPGESKDKKITKKKLKKTFGNISGGGTCATGCRGSS